MKPDVEGFDNARPKKKPSLLKGENIDRPEKCHGFLLALPGGNNGVLNVWRVFLSSFIAIILLVGDFL